MPRPTALLVLGSVFLARTAIAQEGPVTFEFSFSNPGARSMALGGAFAALADDATAAFANPAGLVQLDEPEFSVEARYWSYETPFVTGGRVDGEPTGQGVDTVRGVRVGSSKSSPSDLSFASYIQPFDRWSVALYRHTWADFSAQSRVDGLFGIDEEGEFTRSEDILTSTRFEVVNTGVAIGYQMTPSLSLGLGAVYFQGVLDSVSLEYIQDDDRFFQPNAFAPENLDTSYFHQANDSGITLNGGLLWQVSPQFSLGAYFREGPELDLLAREITGPADDEVPPGTVELDRVAPLKLPDVYGLGGAYRSLDGRWTVGVEWSHVNYSSITDSLNGAVLDSGQVSISDADQLHVGIEYVLVDSDPVIAFRVGGWRDPAHTVGFGPSAGPLERVIFPGGEDDVHLVTGLGFAFDRFQIDLGVDLSDSLNTASLSMVYRF